MAYHFTAEQLLLLEAVVAPRSFHFTITKLSVDRGSSSSAEILQTDLLESYDSWKSLRSSVRPFILLPMFDIEIVWLCASSDTPVSNGCD